MLRAGIRLILAAAAFGLAAAGQAAEPAVPAHDAVSAEERLGPEPRTGPAWRVGRTPEVFQEPGDAVATRIGGWADASYQDNDLPGREFSASLNHLNGFFDTRYREWQLFVETEYEHEDDRAGYEGDRELELEQGYLRFTPDPRLSLRLGRFNTPIGYWNPIHWSILMDTIEKPLFIGREMFPEQQIGLELGGRGFAEVLGVDDVELGYAAYLGYGNDGWAQPQLQGFSGGVDLRALFLEQALFGVSLYRQRNAEALDRSETTLVLYTDLKLSERWTFRSEYFRQRRSRPSGAAWERDIDVVYAKLRWQPFERGYLNYRITYGDDEQDGRNAETLIQTLTLGIAPRSWLLVKLEYSDHQFRVGGRRDFDFWGVSVGALF